MFLLQETNDASVIICKSRWFSAYANGDSDIVGCDN